MAQKIIDTTTQQPNGKIGDTAKVAFGKVNDNFAELYALGDAFKGANQSLSGNGYQKLPGGLIIQWGRKSVFGDTSVNADVTFPIAL